MRRTYRHLSGVRPEDNSPSLRHLTHVNLLCRLYRVSNITIQSLYNGKPVTDFLKSEAYLICDLIKIVREFLLHLESFLNVVVYHFVVLKTYNTVAYTL